MDYQILEEKAMVFDCNKKYIIFTKISIHKYLLIISLI